MMDYDSDSDIDVGSSGERGHHSRSQREAEELERKRAVQARIRKEQAEGPPPDMAKRALIFDSLSKIISRTFGKGASRSGVTGETRGTYIFTWGAGYHGQLGRQFERGRKKFATIPKMVHLDVAIRQIACGGLHTAAVTDAGTVYTWGDARAYQLGYQPHGFTNQPTPRLVDSLDGVAFVVSIACGQGHTVALTDKGSLISWGQSKSGQCGHNDRQVVKTPRKIRMDDTSVKFTQVSCGDKHTAAVTTKGTVWAFGSSQQGQCGFDENPPVDKLRPTEVKALSESGVMVTSVVCGSIHTCMVSEDGTLYICGFGEHFYPNDDQNFFYRPVPIPFNEKVVQVACGQSHILILTANADVYTLGSGSYGQLGQGVKGDLNTPRLVLTGKNIAQVSAGRYHSSALTSFGTVYTWGCGESGQTGHASCDENVLFPRVLEPNLGAVVGQIACGEHHTAVLTSTPWSHVDPALVDWLRSEQEEYALKLKYIKRSNHGLVKKDLLKIQDRMQQLQNEWSDNRDVERKNLDDELRNQVAAVKDRSDIIQEMRVEEERRRTGTWRENQAQQSPLSPQQQLEESKEGGYDRLDSLARLGARPSSGAQTARPSSGTVSGMGVGGGYATARLSSTTRADRTSSSSRFTPGSTGGSLSSRTLTFSAGDFSPAFPLVSGGDSNAARSSFLRESAGMVRRMKGIIAESGDGNTPMKLSKVLESVFAYRKEYDALRNLTRKRQRILDEITRRVESMKKSSESGRSRRRMNELLLKALKMKLSTVTIKIAETEENRRNYALNISHLKEEELERFYQLEALRKQCADTDALRKKINELKLSAVEESVAAENELQEFKNEIAKFHHFIRDQLNKFQQISAVAHARKEKREAEKSSRSKASQDKIAARVAKLTKELESRGVEAISMAAQLESVNERLRYFEKRFQQIASATGLTNPDGIINKFTLKEEIKEELSDEIRMKSKRLAEKTEELAREQEQLARTKAEFAESKWKDVDALVNAVHDAAANATHHQSEADRLDERLAFYREGMLSLLNILPPQLLASESHGGLLSALEGGDLSNEATADLVSLLLDKLRDLQLLVGEGDERRRQREKVEEERRRKQEEQNQARIAQDVAETLKMTTMMKRKSAQNQSNAQPQTPNQQKQSKQEEHANGAGQTKEQDLEQTQQRQVEVA